MENWMILAICLGAVALLVGIWCAVTLLISRFGWAKIAKNFATSEVPSGRRFRFASAFFPPLNSYKNALTVTLTEMGMHISVMPLFRFGHPPLLIPKENVESCTDHRVFGYAKTRVHFVAQDSTFDIMLPPDAREEVECWLGKVAP